MAKSLPQRIKYFVLVAGLIFCLPFRSDATHFYGADLNYTYVSGNTYTINLVVWGDCSGSAFYTLPTSVPVVYIYNGNTSYTNISLIIQAPTTGIEVTPVCPADSNNTTCKNVSNPIPGIKKFVYSANVTLSGPSAGWRFVFTGSMGSVGTAGRSNSITNILSGTNVQLIDTLNNITASNSSPILTNIPTPFFCDNYAANYNPAAVDPNNDSLAFYLVPGINGNAGSTVSTSSVSYLAPYTAVNPLGVSNNIAFNNHTGQLSFTPDIIQRSLLVYNIEEYRNGILVGTSQREMTFVVLSCDDGPPVGSISNASAGTIIDSTDFSICQSVGPFTFHIDPTEANSNNITMTVAGLPPGAIFAITGNGTHTPQGLLSWTTDGVALGTYTFYITYQDDACPLSSRQTQAYTITILPSPTLTVSPLSPATCSHNAAISIMAGGIGMPLTINVLQNGNIVQTINNVTGTIIDSLVGGTYTIRVLNTSLCNKDTTLTLAQPPILYPIVDMISPTCNGGSNGSITVTGSNSPGPYMYAIGGGAFSATNIFSPLSAGTYILHVKDTNNCVKDTIVNLPDAVAIGANIIIKKPLCNDLASGTIVVNAYNSIAPYQYAIGTGAFSTSDTFSNLAPGIYTIHIKSSLGCTKDTSITLVDSSDIHAAFTINNLQCNNDSSGSIIINATGAYLLPYSYILNANPAVYSNTFSHLSAGTYNIQIQDSEHCYFDTSVTISQPTQLLATPVTTNVYCNGSATGIIIFSAGGGTPNYLYNINGGSFSGNTIFSNLTAGTYILDVKDADNCLLSDTAIIQQPPPIVLMFLQNPLLCHGDANASFTVTATGGTAPFTYALNAGSFQTGNVFTSLGPGAYTFSARDGNNCIKDTVITLTDPPSTFANITIKRPSCNGFANGMIVVNGHNSVAPYQYALGNSAYGTADTFANLVSGTYTIKIKNANGCMYDTSVTFADSTQLHASVQLTNILCHGDSTGAIIINPTGAYLQPYNYIINGSAVYNNTFSNLTAGTYAIQVHDSEQCYFDTTVTLTQPTPITINPVITNVNCNGGTTGSITVNAGGGTPGYQYNINGGSFGASNVFSNLAAGTYTVQVYDANGCLMPDAVSVTQSTPIIITAITMQQPLCNGNANGSFTIAASGGQLPYTYAYNTGAYQSGNTLSGLAAGTYTLHVKDAYGCTKDTIVTLSQPTPLVPTALVTNSTCNTLSNGQIVLSGSGGTPGYTYALGTGTYTASGTFTPLASGTYALYVKDANGCVKDTSLTITNTLNVAAIATVTPELCYNQASGMIVMAGVGGTSPYSYQLGAGLYNNVNTFAGLSALTYNIHIKDANGCVYDTNIVVSQPSNILPDISITPPSCYGYSNGSLTIGATGGTPAYTYSLDNGAYQTSGSFAGLNAAIDTLYIKDANGCLHDTVITVTQPSPFIIDSLVLGGIKCFAGNSGSITVFASGGVQPYTFAANAGTYQSANLLTGLYAGANTIQVKDNEGCTIDSTANLTQPPALVINAVSIVNPTCEGYKDGAVTIAAGGGTSPYSYSSGNTNFTATDSFTFLPAGTYTYYVKDANGCSADTTLTLTGYPAIIVSAANVKEPSCYGYHDGAISIIAAGGLPPFTYGIIDSVAGTGSEFDSLFSGSYTIVITDSKGCKLDTAIGLPQPDSLSIEITKVVPNNCYGLDTNGYISVDAAGGTTPYAYKWNTTPIQVGPTASELANGIYIVVVTDANNCTDSSGTKIDYDDCCKPFIPNAFTPNNDGKDDVFRIVFKGDMQLIEFSVYNRFGQCVFTTSDVNKGWDGMFNGTPADMDTYFYYARIICGTDHKVSLKGDVTLIR